MSAQALPPQQPGEVRTTCPYCGVGCGVLVRADADHRVQVRGDPDHPANWGRLCSKGRALGETTGPGGRLLHPRIHGRRCDWATALRTVAEGFSRIIREHGPDAVGFYVSGQLLTEDYYVANKLMKGFIGSANIDTNSRLCMASSVAGHLRAFGEDAVPGNYADLEQADLVVLAGSNLAWCHPVLYRRLEAARARRPDMRVVVIDPRQTETAALADLHLALRPGTDVALWNGLLRHLAESAVGLSERLAEQSRLDSPLNQALAGAPGPEQVADRCGLDQQAVRRFYHWFAATERTVSVYSQGMNQSSQGTDKVNALLNTHVLTGRIGRPGSGPFSVTGQPNAMGGREVGGLANQLAAHMGFSDEERARVQAFWASSRIAERPGLKAMELFRAASEGRIKALWIMGTNPVVSLPDADLARQALARCEWVVASDCMADTDTTRLAHVLLPAAAWGEKSGTVTNSERRISRQRPFRAPMGEARPDWWIITNVARRMGHDAAFPYQSPREIFDEHARLTCVNDPGTTAGGRALDLGALTGLSEAEWEGLEPVQWPCPRRRSDGRIPPGESRLFHADPFPTPDGRPRIVTVCAGQPAHPTDADWPLALNTGRFRDHWHTLTRTGLAPRLNGHEPEPRCDIHPDDARRHRISDGALVRVASRWGEVLLRARHEPATRRGSVFVPMHWNDEHAANARINRVVNPVTDPVSGQPESKHTPVALRSVETAFHAFALSTDTGLRAPDADYWVRARGDGYRIYRLAGRCLPDDWQVWATEWLGSEGTALEMSDQAQGVFRWARLETGRLQACLFVAADPAALPDHRWLGEQMGRGRALQPDQHTDLLAGGPAGQPRDGRPICACFGVGECTLEAVVAAGARSQEAVTRQCKAGGGCGSCRPAIETIIRRLEPAVA